MTGRARGSQSSVFRVARTSTAHLIAVELRKAIRSGALPVGAQIGEVEIAEQLGVSRGPLREAAQRLVEEGVLTSVPGRGLRVTTIGPEEVADVYEARLAVEGQAIRRIVRDERMSSVDAIERAHEDLVRRSAGDDAIDAGNADLEFHQTLVDASGSPRLSRAMTTLALETRIAAFSAPDGYSVRREVSETYRELIGALRDGDAERAVAALEEQFREAVARLRGEVEVETFEPADGDLPDALTPIGSEELGTGE